VKSNYTLQENGKISKEQLRNIHKKVVKILTDHSKYSKNINTKHVKSGHQTQTLTIEIIDEFEIQMFTVNLKLKLTRSLKSVQFRVQVIL
jgi:predicted butyrate kinase (DUF1464 family)